MNYGTVEFLNHLEEWFMLNEVANKSLYIVAFLTVSAFLVVYFSKKFKIPIVVGYAFLGILLSASIVERLPFFSQVQKEWYAYLLESFDYVADLALAFIAFTIGSELSIKVLQNLGKKIFVIAVLESVGAFLLVFLALLAIGKPMYLALILGAVASATAPAATVMVLKEYKAEGPLTSTLLAVVGIDDAIALTIFSFAEPIALMQLMGSRNLSLFDAIFTPLYEILGSILLGLIIGYFAQKLLTDFTDRTLKEMVLVATIIGCSALALSFHFSPLITNMAVGFAFRNFARKTLGIAEIMDTLTVPLYALFFTLAGTKIKITVITSMGFLLLAVIYTLARMVGKVYGAFLGAKLSRAPEVIRKYLGFGLLSQIGVAVALAYTIQRDFINYPDLATVVFNILLFTTAITEVVGPLLTRYAITKAGEAKES